MEEDIKKLKNLINVLNTGMCKFGEKIQMNDCGYQEALEKLLQAYKQDEKVIKEMAKYIDFDKMDFNCGMCVHNGCQEECIIDYFRKRCE